MRLTPTKVLNTITAVVIFILLYTVFVQQAPPESGGGGGKSTFDSTCSVPESYRDDLQAMVYAAHEVLDGLDLAHFLCYGSLFGQLRHSASLPWERDAEMCVLNEEVSRYDEVFIKRAFWKRGLDVVYDSAEGRYIVTVDRRHAEKDEASGDDANSDGDRFVAVKPHVKKTDDHDEEDESKVEKHHFHRKFEGVLQLVVFADDKSIEKGGESMYHRVGWKRRLLPPDCDYSKTLECFPSRLAQSPLPLKLFGTRAVPVPREEFELLKYHYPDNWWKEVKPLNC